MRYRVGVSEMMSCGHYIKDYEGKCKNLHGHNYKVELIVEGDKLDNLNMLIDAVILKKVLHNITEKFDHRVLNEVLMTNNATAELLAETIYSYIKRLITDKKVIVKVYETPNIWVEVSE
jgi:6-pyruvoyltetrahydropterin/6-carboxytetrahydropterin synthase